MAAKTFSDVRKFEKGPGELRVGATTSRLRSRPVPQGRRVGDYVAADRLDIQVVVSHLCSAISTSTEASRMAASGSTSRGTRGSFSSSSANLSRGFVFSGSDLARCRVVRQGRRGHGADERGGLIYRVVAISAGQGTTATASVKTCGEALGMQHLGTNLGYEVGGELYVDSSAVKAIASTLRLGRVDHFNCPVGSRDGDQEGGYHKQLGGPAD